MNTDAMFSSKTDLWETPIDFFREWDEKFHFDLDVCANADNAKCATFFSPEQDGLKQNWGGGGVHLLDESSVWAEDRGLGAQGIRRINAGCDGCLPASRADRHEMVARLLYARGNNLYPGTAEIRRQRE